jgi:nitrate reductase gamma subunit
MKPTFVFAAWPYVALAVLGVGVVLRFVLVRQGITAVKAELPESWAVLGGSRLWRISTALLFLGHLAGLAFPHGILLWDSSTIRLYVLEGFVFAIGVLALVGWIVVMWRHLKRSDGSVAADLADTVFLASTFVVLLSGLLMSILYRWGSFWGVVTLRPYVASLLHGTPEPGFVTQMPFLVRLHIFSSFTAVALFPFTRLAPLFVLALHRAIGRMSKPVSKLGDAADVWLQRHKPGAWIWPEED